MVRRHHWHASVMNRLRNLTAALTMIFLAGALTGCGGPEVMIASSVAQAAIKASIEHAEKNKPTPEQAWRAARREYLEERGHAGDPKAQYTLGQLYHLHRHGDAHYWMCEAANNGHPAAQLQLGHWYNEDRLEEDPWPFIGVTPDNQIAYMWYALAEKNGDTSGTPFLLDLKYNRLAPEELQAADAQLATWAPGSCGVLVSVDAERTD